MDFKILSYTNKDIFAILRDYPSVCPNCQKTIMPRFVSHSTTIDRELLYAFLSCPDPSCEVAFSAEYQSGDQYHYEFNQIVTKTNAIEQFDSEISAVSPSFVKIYNEAFSAEQYSLLEVAGVGYRKAFEFLIKDYLIKEKQVATDKVLNAMLGSCIKEFVDDNRIKESAKRAVWLGNDQTHYTKKWVNKDLKDLKMLIKLSINWISSELLTKQLHVTMPE